MTSTSALPAIIVGGAVLSVVLAFLGVRVLLGLGLRRRQAVEAAESVRANHELSGLDELDRRFRRTRVGRRVERELSLGGLRRRPVSVAMAAVAVGAVATYVLWTFLAPLLGVAGLLVGFLTVRAYLRRAQQRRREAFIGQLPELARVLANASYAGLSLPTAIAIAGDEMNEPAKSELTQVATRLGFGAPLDRALEELRARVGSRETNVLISTLLVSSRSGGSLVSALRDIADTLDQRKETRREVQSILAQPVATSYTVVLLGFGVLILLNIMKPGTVEKMTQNVIGQLGLVIAAALFASGFVIIRRMTRFDL